jgi:D-glycero-D-manno-heptose 1,7-bisphosphate phosphatase
MNNITIGLDRDGTINEDIGTYVTHPMQFKPITNSLEAVALLRKKGYNIVVLTNQAGVSKGIMTTEQVAVVHDYMLNLLGQVGCESIDGIYYSHTSQKNDIFAKPNIGMFKKAESECDIKFKDGFYVGDKLTDLKAAEKIGATPILVRTGYGAETEKKLKRFTYKNLARKTMVFDNLWDFASSLPDPEIENQTANTALKASFI